MFDWPHLPIARYRFTAIVREALQLPEYAGSLLRGQFGAALRHVACMTRQSSCSGCPLTQTCPYSRIFEAPAPPKGAHALQDFSQIPNPYIIEPPTLGARQLLPGEELVFHIVLIGHAISQLPLVIFALQRALARGLSHARVHVDLIQVDHVDGQAQACCVWHQDQPVLQEHDALLRVPALNIAIYNIANSTYPISGKGQNDIKLMLDIKTPLRLQNQGQPLRIGQLSARTLLAALVRRCALLLEFHGRVGTQDNWGTAAKAAVHMSESLRETQALQWFDWGRYSSRQQQRMTLGGVLGDWTLHVDDSTTLTELWPWLWLGQWLHVGKNATMGLGGYTLQTVSA